MEELIENLKNPFENLSKEEIQKKCSDIAKDLFCNYCINCNDNKYYFAEIEFYYWEKNWNKMDYNAHVTYPRDGYDAKDLLYHLSGVDICFKSSFKEAKFGGILIRAIRDKEGNITAGPWNCMLKILNECNGGNMPKIESLKEPCNNDDNIKNTFRALGKSDMNAEKDNPLKLCYYDSSIPSIKWKSNKKIFNKKDGCIIDRQCSYKTDRFYK